MIDNLVKIFKEDNRVCVRDDEVMVNCRCAKDATDCAMVMNEILNEGESVISMDYLDFKDKSGIIEYDFEVVNGIDICDYSESIARIDLSEYCKYVLCIVGNISLAEVTGVMEDMMGTLDSESTPVVSFGYICDENYQENVFDMYIWKER